MYKIPRFKPSLSRRTLISILRSIFTLSPRKNSEDRAQLFEDVFAKYIGVRNAICVPSGRMGLFLIFKSLCLKERSQVILPAFTYWAVPSTVSFLNLEPVFVDIDPKTCNLDVSQIEKNITKFTKAILPTHLYGLPCQMDEILAIAKKYNLLVIEDCVQACGAEYKGKKVGSLGEASYFSFGITKNLFLLGGGMVVTNSDDLAKKIREEVNSYGFLNKRQLLKKTIEALVMQLFTSPFIFSFFLFPFMRLCYLLGRDIIGDVFEEKKRIFKDLPKSYFKLVPLSLQAEIGAEQLSTLDSLNNKRIKNASYLLEKLKGLNGVSLPAVFEDGIKNIFTNFPIRTKNRDFFARELLKRKIDTSCGYMRAHSRTSLNAMAVGQTILHLPIHASLNESQLLYVSQILKEIVGKVEK